MATATQPVAAPNVTRVQDFDLAGIIQYQRDSIRERKFSILGRCTNIRLGVDDRAEYTRGDAWRRVCAQSKVIGLTLEWPSAEAPYVAFAPDHSTLLFPDGIERPPKISVRAFQRVDLTSTKLPPGMRWNGSQLVADNENGRITQSLFDFASGSLTGRDQSRFVILQPVEQVIVLANVASSRFRTMGTMLDVKGRATFDGRHPFLLASPFNREAYLAGGRFTFDSV